jgi:YVTN family beta-propeller protein
MDRRCFAIGSLVLTLLALAAVPGLASARTAFVTGADQMSGAHVARWNLATQAILPPETSFGGESSAPDVAITPDGTRAYVVESSNQVVPFDVATGAKGTPIGVGSGPVQIAITPDGTRAYVTNLFGSSVSVINLATNTVTATIPVGDEPIGIAITPDGTRAYVANREDDTVSRIDLATNAVTTIAVGDGPSGISITPDGSRAYVTDQFGESVSRIDLATDAVATFATSGTRGGGIAITPSGGRAYVLSDFGSSHQILPIALAGDVAGTPIPMSSFLEDVAILPNGSRAYVAAESPDLLIPIDLGTDAALPGFAAGNRPEAVAIVPNQPPHAIFSSSPATPEPGATVAFDATASNDPETAPEAPGSVARYDWEFGDGTSAANAGPKPTHAFAKAGTYTVTLTTTDNEGCSTRQIFTGQTAYCNGSSVARTTRTVTVGAAAPKTCNRVKGNAGSFVPKRRPGQVVPGVRVLLSASAPARLAVAARIEWSRRHGGTGNMALGKASVRIEHWRRIRFAIPASLDDELPLGTAVTVTLKIETTPIDASCSPTFTNRTLHLHVVKVFPDAVQAARPR